ncbi:MAG: T9SS type A sorting domain-containing protein [Bacteroidales bacterium]|jgi:hypothetical protein|nr:T9SS type A sorting domain-containing protein [Bacteroidales bacterium]
MSKVLFTLYFGFLISIVGLGQETGVLTGVLTDQYTGNPLFGVKVRAWEQGNAEAQKSSVFVALSDEDGIFSLDLPAGQYQASFSRYGLYGLEISEIEVVTGDTITYYPTMSPYPVPLSNLKATLMDGSWIMVTWSTSGPNIQEFNHDDGEADDMFVFADSGNQIAVKYSYTEDQHVIGGRIFTGDSTFPGPFLGTDFMVRIYDNEGMNGLPGNILDEDTVIADQYGWVGFDNLNAYIETDNFYLGTVQIHDAPYCAPVGSAQYPPGSHSIMRYGDFNWDQFPIGNAMIRPWVAKEHSQLQPVSFRVARLMGFDPEGDPMSGSLYEIASTQNYFYNDYAILQPGFCAYAVKILYNDGTYSPYIASNVVYYLHVYDFGVKVYLSDSLPASGKIIKLEGITAARKTYSSVIASEDSAHFNAMQGTYRLKSFIPGYEPMLVDSVKVQNDTTFTITFQESVYPVENPRINPYSAILSWDEPYIEQFSWLCESPDSCYSLVTPELDLTSANHWYMTVGYDYQYEYARARIEYSTDHGRSWATLHEFEAQPDCDTIDIDLSALQAESAVIFRLLAIYVIPQYLRLHSVSIWTPDFKASPGDYHVTLNGLLEGIADTSSYKFLTLVNGQTYKAGVQGIYSTGTTDTAFVEFTYHELFPPEDLAWEEENDTLVFSWSKPSGSWNSDKAPGDYPDALNGYALTYHTSDHLYRFEIDGPATTSFRFEKPDCDSATAILTAVYDLSDFGYPGSQFESKPAGPLQIKFDGPVENEFFEDWSAISLIHNCWKMTGNGLSIEAGQGFPGAALIYQNPPSHYQVFLTSVPINIPESADAQRLLECDLTLFAGGYSGYEIMEIHLQQAGSSYWDVVQEFSNSSGSFDWSHYSLDLSGYISSDEFRVRFKFEGIGAEPVQWKVDNIHLHRVCSGPTTLQAELTGENEVSLNWLANTATKSATSFEHYNIFRKTGQDGFSLLATTTDTFYLDYLTEGGRYSYRVNAAYNDNGILCTSSPSDSAWIVSTYDIPENDIHGRISVYPNPVNERLFIVSDEMIYGINLYNSLGICVLDMDKSGLNFEIDMKFLANGIYFLRIELENKDYNGKIIH